jgi:hypothetical protein
LMGDASHRFSVPALYPPPPCLPMSLSLLHLHELKLNNVLIGIVTEVMLSELAFPTH